MLDRVTGLQVFSRVAGLGSLSAAARALGMSQTMATKHMAALESRLGVRLLHRSTRRLTLTEAGRVYLEAVERILGDIEDADAHAAAETVEVKGTLRLNAPVSFGVRELAPLLPELAQRHPALAVELGLNDRLVDLIEEGWDLAVRIGNLDDSTSLIARRLAPCRTLVCASPGYLTRHGRPRTVADLAQHDCLGYTLSRAVGVDRWAFGDGRVRVGVKGSLRANNGDVLVAAAVAGQGIVYQPTFLVGREIEAGRLVPLALDHPPLELGGIYAVHASGRRPPAKVRAVIDFLAERLGAAGRPTERRGTKRR